MSRKNCAHSKLIDDLKAKILGGEEVKPYMNNDIFCNQCKRWIDFPAVKKKAEIKAQEWKERMKEHTRR